MTVPMAKLTSEQFGDVLQWLEHNYHTPDEVEQYIDQMNAFIDSLPPDTPDDSVPWPDFVPEWAVIYIEIMQSLPRLVPMMGMAGTDKWFKEVLVEVLLYATGHVSMLAYVTFVADMGNELFRSFNDGKDIAQVNPKYIAREHQKAREVDLLESILKDS